MKTCMILEDEPLAQQLLAEFISRVPGLELVATTRHPAEAFGILHKQPVDLLFLDIQLPVLTGLQFIRSLQHPPAVIIITAFPEHAVESYEIEAVDYLLKPVSFERFQHSVNRYLKQSNAVLPANNYSFFKVNGKFIKLEHESILYAQSIRDYIMLYTSSGNHITHMTMKNLCTVLPSPAFRRVHRSFLANEQKVTVYGKNELMLGEVKIPIGKNYKGSGNAM
jgi:DNA-binding LytR/AlgR family response regulator